MIAKCNECGFKGNVSEFKFVLLIPNKGAEYSCPKCNTIGLFNGNIEFVDGTVPLSRQINVHDILEEIKKLSEAKK